MSFGSSRNSRGRGTFNEINITPLTDVFLVLLVVMFLIAPLLDKPQASLEIVPPVSSTAKESKSSAAQKDPGLIFIEVDKDGKVNLDNKTISQSNKNKQDFERTTELVYEEIVKITGGKEKIENKVDVKLLPDQSSPVGLFVAIYDAISQAKQEKRVRDFSLLVSKPKPKLSQNTKD